MANVMARVFPRRTRATPTDDLAFTGPPDLFARTLGITCVHVSVAFTWDKDRALRLADAWDSIAPVEVGGPAFNGGVTEEFTPGRYLGEGYTITSTGCPRGCSFCRVKHPLKLLTPIVPGWRIQDDNLLACPRDHFESVIGMLATQRCRAEFTGGLEALMLEDWHVHGLASLKPLPACFFAYDPGDAYETLAIAAGKMLAAGWTRSSHRLRCYVLIGFPPKEDTFEKAEKRLTDMLGLGYTPHAMLWKHPKTGLPPSDEWRAFQRRWVRPAIIHAQSTEPRP